MCFSLSDKVVKSTRVAQRLFEGSMLVITAHDSMLHRFNEPGTFIWEIIKKPITIEEIGNSICTNFDEVDKKKMYSDLFLFLSELHKKQLIKIQK
jgi:hypothetical protein